jgi:hypothetical protein
MADTPGNVNAGGALFYPGSDYIYALGGDSTRNFWRYTGTLDSWAPMADTPGTVGSGGDLIFTSSTRGFALRGRNSRTFWEVVITPPQYDINSQAGALQTTTRYEIDGSSTAVISWDIN